MNTDRLLENIESGMFYDAQKGHFNLTLIIPDRFKSPPFAVRKVRAAKVALNYIVDKIDDKAFSDYEAYALTNKIIKEVVYHYKNPDLNALEKSIAKILKGV